MTIKAKVFQSSTKTWEDMCEEVSLFASPLGPERLVNISVSEAGGADLGGKGARGTIIVWYWE